jgi:hypothetical protein
MSNNIQELKDLIVDYRNSVKNNLSDTELVEVDKYIDKIVQDIGPLYKMIESMTTNKTIMSKIKENLDDHMREDEWLEKLSKTS